MAKAYALTQGFGLDRLTCQGWPVAAPPENHVRVAVEAGSLNRRDLLLIEGQYAPRLRLPAIPCSDAAGRVMQRGPRATRFADGDRVVAHMFPDWLAGAPTSEALRSALGGPVRQGTLATEIVLPETALLPVPDFLTAPEAATLRRAGGVDGGEEIRRGGPRPQRAHPGHRRRVDLRPAVRKAARRNRGGNLLDRRKARAPARARRRCGGQLPRRSELGRGRQTARWRRLRPRGRRG